MSEKTELAYAEATRNFLPPGLTVPLRVWVAQEGEQCEVNVTVGDHALEPIRFKPIPLESERD